MEYVFSIKDKKVLLYDSGNVIYYNIFLGNRILQTKIIARDYHIGFSCIRNKNNLYVVYITVARELVWHNVSEDSRLILFEDRNELWNMEDVKLIEFYGEPVIFFQVKNPVTENVELRYIFPECDKKIRVLVTDNNYIENYLFYTGLDEMLLVYKTSLNKDGRYFILNEPKDKDIKIKEYIFCEKEALSNMKREYDNSLKSGYEQIENHYKNQYYELEKMAKELQEEGKKWRDLYYKMVGKKRNYLT